MTSVCNCVTQVRCEIDVEVGSWPDHPEDDQELLRIFKLATPRATLTGMYRAVSLHRYYLSMFLSVCLCLDIYTYVQYLPVSLSYIVKKMTYLCEGVNLGSKVFQSPRM